MKKAEEYIKDMNFSTHLLDYLEGVVQPDAVIGSFKFRLFNTIKRAQIDAINQTYRFCAENAELSEFRNGLWIANYKKFNTHQGFLLVDKQSIISVGEQLKKELL